MGFGSPSKALFAARLAAVFSYVALHNYDLVAVAGGEKLDRYYPPRGGKAAIPEVWGRISSVLSSPEGQTDFTALRGFQHVRRGRGICIVPPTCSATQTGGRVSAPYAAPGRRSA
jgi:hypothetical protein